MGKSIIKSKLDGVSKAERKFEKKVQFYTKVRETVASLTVKKTIGKKKLRSRQKKLKAYDLSTLSEFLPELKAPRQPNPAANFKLSSKSRGKLILKEDRHLNEVLNHPVFQKDPLGSIHQHLQSTQPISDDEPKKKPMRNGGKKKNKKNLKASSGQQSMEI